VESTVHGEEDEGTQDMLIAPGGIAYGEEHRAHAGEATWLASPPVARFSSPATSAL